VYQKPNRRRVDLADKKINIRVKTTGAEKAKKSFDRLGKSLQGTILGLGALSLLVAKAGKDLLALTSKAQGVEAAFNKLNRSGLLDELRKATRGTVSDLELMVNAVQAKNLGIPLEELATLLKFASIRARETGESVEYLVQSIVTGIGRKSVLILDNLGLSAVKIQEEFKKTGNFAAAVGKIVKEDLANMDENIAPVADAVDRATVAVDNFQKKMSETFGVLFEGLTESGELLDKFNSLLKWGASIWSDWDFTLAGVTRKTFNFLTTINSEVAKPGGMWDEAAWKARKKAILAANSAVEITGSGKKVTEVIEEITYAMAQLQIAGMGEKSNIIDRMGFGERDMGRIMGAFREVEGMAQSTFNKVDDDMSQWVFHAQELSNQLIDTFGYVFTETLIREKGFGDAMVAGFKSMLERMVADFLARAAVFGIMSMFGVGGIGTFTSAVLRPVLGISGTSPTVSERGGSSSTVNVNMPNVTMINSRSISQINQALTRHKRLH